MIPNNLVQNGDFSAGFTDWTLTGLTQNAQIVTEGGNQFARFGPSVNMYQDVNVNANDDYVFAFRFRAPYVGNGLDVKIQGLDANNNPSAPIIEQTFPQTQNWTRKGIQFNVGPFTKVRITFIIFSAADIDDVGLFATGQPNQNGLFGSYYNGTDFNTLVFQRVDPQIDFFWPFGSPPALGNQKLNNENYSIRWLGYALMPFVPIDQPNRRIIFRTISDDGVRLWVYPLNTTQPAPIINNWTIHSATANDSLPQDLVPGDFYNIQIDFFNAPNIATIQLMYYFEGDDPQTAKNVPTELLFPKTP
ncbi:hypothetical protein FOA24_03335 [Bacillus thuringiensis]|uniref:PA14 domain-containing protein n=1 Tax=Bacillus thuringiensis TaxID=1428 RepID=UPI0033379EFA